MRTIEWVLRASEPTERLPNGHRAERVTVTVDDDEYVWLRERYRSMQARGGKDTPEGRAVFNEMCAFVEVKVLLDASAAPHVPPFFDEPDEPVVPEPTAAQTEALARVESMESRGYRFPAAAKRAVEVGQLSIGPGALGPEAVQPVAEDVQPPSETPTGVPTTPRGVRRIEPPEELVAPF